MAEEQRWGLEGRLPCFWAWGFSYYTGQLGMPRGLKLEEEKTRSWKGPWNLVSGPLWHFMLNWQSMSIQEYTWNGLEYGGKPPNKSPTRLLLLPKQEEDNRCNRRVRLPLPP